jgi:hypothetical protein
MAKKAMKKPTLAVTLDPEVIEELKAIAKTEQRSVSQIVQWALVQYFPIIRGGMNDPSHYSLEKMIGRLYSALTTSDMLQCGIHPKQISLDQTGQIKIQLNQQTDESGNPKPLTFENDNEQMGCAVEMTGTVIETGIDKMPPSGVSEQTPNPIFDDLMKKKKKADMKRIVTRAKQTT